MRGAFFVFVLSSGRLGELPSTLWAAYFYCRTTFIIYIYKVLIPIQVPIAVVRDAPHFSNQSVHKELTFKRFLLVVFKFASIPVSNSVAGCTATSLTRKLEGVCPEIAYE